MTRYISVQIATPTLSCVCDSFEEHVKACLTF